MDNKDRSPGNTAISISLSEELLYQIDARAKRLGVPRSTYLVQLARKDILAGGNLALQELGTAAGDAALNPRDVIEEMRQIAGAMDTPHKKTPGKKKAANG